MLCMLYNTKLMLSNQTHENQSSYLISHCTNNVWNLSKCKTKTKYGESGIPRAFLLQLLFYFILFFVELYHVLAQINIYGL